MPARSAARRNCHGQYRVVEKTSTGATYSAVNVVLLRLFEELSVLPAMDHSAMHRDCFVENGLKKLRPVRFLEGVDATLRHGQVD